MKVSRTERITVNLLFTPLVVFSLLPFAWMLLTSFKSSGEAFTFPVRWLPEHVRWGNYVSMWTDYGFARAFWNTGVVGLLTTLVSLAVAAPAGYALSRFRFKGDRLVVVGFLAAQMLPGTLLLLSYFLLMKALGLLNTYAALVIADTTFGLPLATLLLRAFFDTIPPELDEAARVDGCSYLGAFLRISLPLAGPALAAAAIFVFLVAWGEFLFPLGLTLTPDKRVVTVAIAGLIGEFRVDWNLIMAAAVATVVPVIIFFKAVERHLLTGLTAGGVKG